MSSAGLIYLAHDLAGVYLEIAQRNNVFGELDAWVPVEGTNDAEGVS